MGAIRLRIPCAKTDSRDLDWSVVQRTLWSDWLLPDLHASLQHPEYRVVLRYLESAASDGFAEGDWCVDENEMTFRFPDYGGTSHVSAEAGLHFVESLLARYLADRRVRWVFSDDGWTLRPRKRNDIAKADAPLIALRGTLYLARVDGARISLSSDGATRTQPRRPHGCRERCGEARNEAPPMRVRSLCGLPTRRRERAKATGPQAQGCNSLALDLATR